MSTTPRLNITPVASSVWIRGGVGQDLYPEETDRAFHTCFDEQKTELCLNVLSYGVSQKLRNAIFSKRCLVSLTEVPQKDADHIKKIRSALLDWGVNQNVRDDALTHAVKHQDNDLMDEVLNLGVTAECLYSSIYDASESNEDKILSRLMQNSIIPLNRIQCAFCASIDRQATRTFNFWLLFLKDSSADLAPSGMNLALERKWNEGVSRLLDEKVDETLRDQVLKQSVTRSLKNKIIVKTLNLGTSQRARDEALSIAVEKGLEHAFKEILAKGVSEEGKEKALEVTKSIWVSERPWAVKILSKEDSSN